MLTNIYHYLVGRLKKTSSENDLFNIATKNEHENETSYLNETEELEKEIINNKMKKLVVRKYDQKVIKDIKIKETNACYVTFPCLHDVIIIFDDNKYEDTTMSIIVIYELWKKLSFDITIKFLKHCKDEYNKINLKENIVDAIFLDKYDIS
jgi:hypothetical protein